MPGGARRRRISATRTRRPSPRARSTSCAQHVLGMAVRRRRSTRIDLYDEIRSAYPYRTLDWETFERVVDFVATGGYALRAYERYAKIRRRKDGRWRITHPNVAKQYRLNVGTIVELAMLPVRLVSWRSGVLSKRRRGARAAGGVLPVLAGAGRHVPVRRPDAEAGGGARERGARHQDQADRAEDPRTTAARSSRSPPTWRTRRARDAGRPCQPRRLCPSRCENWLDLQGARSRLPTAGELLVETFPRGRRHYLVAYPFEGRLAHQTLGMLLTRRLERMGCSPMGFVASDYALAVWALARSLGPFRPSVTRMAELFSEDMLGDDLDEWLADSMLLKRTFRAVAQIAHLVERRHPGQEKTGRQITISTDLIYDVLRSHEPDHILLRATWADAATGLLDIRRLGQMLGAGEERHRPHAPGADLPACAVPIMLEIGRETVHGEGADALLAEAADALVREAMG